MNWLDNAAHRRWLESETDRLLEFGRGARDPDGGFGWLDDNGNLDEDYPLELWGHGTNDPQLRARADARPPWPRSTARRRDCGAAGALSRPQPRWLVRPGRPGRRSRRPE